jgi:hypothetical protein
MCPFDQNLNLRKRILKNSEFLIHISGTTMKASTIGTVEHGTAGCARAEASHCRGQPLLPSASLPNPRSRDSG